ncbi:MAG TPA: glycosyltransferase [Methylomirabilota bacterium]|jgi:hypothetical protein|nr:glycosyltransferase [Methylomirabilota bacterium]
MVSAPRALVVVPTHDHPETLDLAVESALAQTVGDLEVVIVGDGVGDDTRAVATGLCRQDRRVRFVDRPKSSGRAEQARHEVVAASPAPVITYLGDDDLLLGDHVELMLALLADHDFAHPYPAFLDEEGRVSVRPTDLGDPACVAWHLRPGHNVVSLTGAAHTRALYARLPHGWRPAPPGVPSDHHMWQQIFVVPGVRLVTAPRSTTIKFPAALRRGWSPARTRATALDLATRIRRPAFHAEWDAEVSAAVRRAAAVQHRELSVATRRVAELEGRAAALERELAAMRATRTWRWHDRLARSRVLRRVLTRHRAAPAAADPAGRG